MRVYLAMVAKRPGVDLSRHLSLARSLLRDVFPVPLETVDAAEWVSADSALLAWSNEEGADGRPPLIVRENRDGLGISGTVASQRDVRRLTQAPVLRDVTADLSGCFSVIRVAEEEIQAATASTRALSVFYAENEDLHLVGTRALHVHLVANNGKVAWNEVALQTMIRQGYFLSDETPYRGVTALGPSSIVTVKGGRRSIVTRSLPPAEPMPASARAKRRAISQLGDALVAAVEPLRTVSASVNLALTGGRDSRLMAALLHAARVPFRATTNGLDTHPDVIIARAIAAHLRIDHTVIPPVQNEAKDAVLVPHPSVRAYEVIRACEGMTSAYESIVDYRPYSTMPTMSGQSGEILRGGFLYSQGQTTDKAMRRRVDDLFLKNEPLFTDEANEHARELAAPWLRRAGENPWEVLDHLYVTYRVGRWHAAARTGSLRRGDPIQPFLDNRVVTEALSLDQRWRHSEEVVYELTRRLAPGLQKIELEGKPWRFQAGKAESPGRWWQRKPSMRTPVPPVAKRGSSWNWRTSPGPHLSALLGEFVLERADALASLVRGDELKAFFSEPVIKQPALAWNLYTVAALLTGAYPGEPPAITEPVRIEIPQI
ncbi:asparagine synthase-related protein [Nonomuraea sp. SYSU D8015]|uniref:asparagine synthase-related protein n=1 Tax=Nonomuraea sp. SYSU D8015 TaxID=2593644 RepID=UPI00166181A7|nr:asparagine synthase-related protein [Nonomuraea sp. SYSU D8015]